MSKLKGLLSQKKDGKDALNLGRVLTFVFACLLIIYSIILLLSSFKLFTVDQELILTLMERTTYPLITTMSYALGRRFSESLNTEFGSDDSEVE